MSENQSQHQLIITGFHRSGTSLTAQYLHRAGLNLGDNLLGANPSNPDGHFEDRDIVALHQEMLQAAGRDWHTPGKGLSESAGAYSTHAQNILARFQPDRPFGFKDPRSSLFLPWWHAQLKRPCAVIVFRHYAECFRSLRYRQSQNLAYDPARHQHELFFWQQPDRALELWLSYNLAIIDYTRAEPDTTLVVSHQGMLNGFNLPAAVNERFGMDLQTDCDSGIRRHTGSRRTGATLSESAQLSPDLLARAEACLNELHALAATDTAHTPLANTSALTLTEKTAHGSHSRISTRLQRQLDQLNVPPLEAHTQDMQVERSGTSEPDTDTEVGHAEQSEDVKELIHWGKRHQTFNNLSSAEACWLKAHKLAPANVASLLHLALLARNRGENRKTALLMHAAIQLKPDNAGFHFHLARALQDSGKVRRSLSVTQHGLTLQHNHVDLQLLQIKLLVRLKRPLEALEACRHALTLFPEDARFLKAMVALDESSPHAAMQWYRRSVQCRLKQQPHYRQALNDALSTIPPTQQRELEQRLVEELSALNKPNRSTTPNRQSERSDTTATLRLAMSILVRDEVDIIEDNILYHAAAGVDHFIVTDNGSVDGTREVLEALRQVVDLEIIDERSHTIDQDLWVTRMAHQVRDSNSADWIINNDADEFWITQGRSLKEAIVADLNANADVEAGTLYCPRFNLIPSLEAVVQTRYLYYDNAYRVIETLIEPDQVNPWHENDSNSLIRTLPGKVISRLDGLGSIDMGNHGAQHEHERIDSQQISIAHYPVRSYEQFERKVINYGKSLAKNTRFAKNISRHLRFWYEQYLQDQLYHEYLKFVLTEQRLVQLQQQGIVVPDQTIGSDIRSYVQNSRQLFMAKAS